MVSGRSAEGDEQTRLQPTGRFDGGQRAEVGDLRHGLDLDLQRAAFEAPGETTVVEVCHRGNRQAVEEISEFVDEGEI